MTKEEFRKLCKAAWEKQHGFESLILAVKTATVNIEVGLTGFTCQIQLEQNKYHFLITKWRIFLNEL